MTTATGQYRAARDSALIADRNLRVLRKNPGRMIYPLVQPLVLLVMFVSVFGNLAITGHAGGASGTYREFLIPGIIIENAALTAPTTGLSLLRDSSSGLADRFRSLPMSRAAVLAGRLASDAIVFAVQAVLLLALATMLGFHMRHGLATMAAITAVTVAFGVGFAVSSAWLALLINDPETAERVLFFPAIVLAFISSAFAPIADLAGWMQPVARVNPVTAAASVIRSLASGGPLAAPLLELGCWTAALVLVPGILAARRWNAARLTKPLSNNYAAPPTDPEAAPANHSPPRRGSAAQRRAGQGRAGQGSGTGADDLFRWSCRPPDPRHDPVSLDFGDRDEVVHGVTALGRVEQWRELPLQVPREHLVNLPAALDPAEHANRPVGAAVLVEDRVVGDLVGHRFLSGKSLISSVPGGVTSGTFTRRWNSSSSSRSTCDVSSSGRRSRS
jgi:oleandomycin transport system permease protein